MKSKRAFTLPDVLCAIVIIAIGLVGMIQFASGVSEYMEQSTIASVNGTERLIRQAQASEGGALHGFATLDPILPAKRMAFSNPVTGAATAAVSGSPVWTAYGVTDLAAGGDKKHVQGLAGCYLIAVQTIPSGGAGGKLNPPTFSLANNATPATFPIQGLVVGNASNPPGTFYRYTIDGTNPTANSPIWTGQEFSGLDYPQTIKAQAYHVLSQWTPSNVVTLTLSYPVSGLSLSRQNVAGYAFGYVDVILPRNGVFWVLNSTYTGSYTINTGAAKTITANSVWWPAIGDFSSGSATVTGKAIPVNPNFASMPSNTKTYTLTRTPAQLAAP